MARSSLLVVLGLLVASIAVPALAVTPVADSQVWQFAATGGGNNVPYSGHDSPAVAEGYVDANSNYWNYMRASYNSDSYYNGPNSALGFRTADGAAATGDVLFTSGLGYPVRGPIQFEGGMEISGTGDLLKDFPTAIAGWAHGPTGYFTGNFGNYGTSPRAVASTTMMGGDGWSGNVDIGVRYKGFEPGTYRVYVVADCAWSPSWKSDISIGVNLNAPVDHPVRLGDAANPAWVNGSDYTVQNVTITSASDWITVLASPCLKDTQSGGWPALDAVQIVKLPSAIPGDADGNGKVNFDDYLVLESSFGTNVTKGTGADFNGDGAVNFDDYLVLESHFGTGSAVPEPMTLSLLGLGALALIRRRQA